MEFKDVVKEQASTLFYSDLLATRDKMYHFGKFVDEYGNGNHPLRLWKISDQVCCNLLLLVFWQKNGLLW